MSLSEKESTSEQPEKSEPRSFWRDLLRGPKVPDKKEAAADKEPEKVESNPEKWETKEVIKLLRKYDSHIDLSGEERDELAEKFDPGKKTVKKKHFTDTLKELHSEYKRAPDADKKRIAAEGKKSLNRFLKGK